MDERLFLTEYVNIVVTIEGERLLMSNNTSSLPVLSNNPKSEEQNLIDINEYKVKPKQNYFLALAILLSSIIFISLGVIVGLVIYYV